MVLRSTARPIWLSDRGPERDVVLSTRVRYMRNLAKHRFASCADSREAREIMAKVLQASDDRLFVHKDLTNAERDHLVLARLVSPEFPWTEPGRALLLDSRQETSVMVNEEDHLRIQVLSAGWNAPGAESLALATLRHFEATLAFAWSPRFGHLAASPMNCGAGRRVSSMFHLIGLAHVKRLPTVVAALAAQGLSVRGLFGESSRAVGAYAQVSLLNGSDEDFIGACDYLLREERQARGEIPPSEVREKAQQARDFASSSWRISLGDALRVLAWVRWEATAGQNALHQADIDAALTGLEIRAPLGEDQAAADRADTLRSLLKL